MTLSGISVLLAEDNPTNQMVAMHMLESLGARVTLAQDGEEALEAVGGGSFDVALIDIEMPRMSGLDLIRRLRSRPDPVASMPLIALTAYVMREHRAAIEDAGADGIISKPIVSIGTFGTEILAHIRQRRGSASVVPDAEPVLDRDAFEGLCAGLTAETRRELVQRIAGDIVDACEWTASAIRAGDLAALQRATHPLASIAGTIGAARLEVLARRLGADRREPDPDLNADGSELLLEAERVLKLVCGGMEDPVQ